MKFSFDLDGTAWKHRETFKRLAHTLKESGHQVGILTAHKGLKERDIALWLRRGFPSPDFYIAKENSKKSTPLFKADAMKEYKIDVHYEDFDGDIQYQKQMLDNLKYGIVIKIK